MSEDARKAEAIHVSIERLQMMASHPARVLQGDARLSIKAGELRSIALEALQARRSSLADTQTAAARDVLAERQRQIESEGWTATHDDRHDKAEMARAAASYVLQFVAGHTYFALSSSVRAVIAWLWPWDAAWFKPTGGRRDLVKAGALIIAEIERIDRQIADTRADVIIGDEECR